VRDAALGNPSVDVGRALSLPRSSGARPLAATAIPLRREPSFFGEAGVAAVLMVDDPERALVPPAGWLERLYGLTPAEARVAVRIADGLAPREVAAELGVRYETVRTQLKCIFSKTRTSRQSALARLVHAGLPGAVRRWRECVRQ
jgi:DNA-binding CsgD family transcriptional regulator